MGCGRFSEHLVDPGQQLFTVAIARLPAAFGDQGSVWLGQGDQPWAGVGRVDRKEPSACHSPILSAGPAAWR